MSSINILAENPEGLIVGTLRGRFPFWGSLELEFSGQDLESATNDGDEEGFNSFSQLFNLGFLCPRRGIVTRPLSKFSAEVDRFLTIG